MARTWYKVPSLEVNKDGLAYINVKLAPYGAVPNTVVAGWHKNPDLNTWQKELLGAGENAATLPYDDAKVGANVKRAVSEFEAVKAARPGKKRGRE